MVRAWYGMTNCTDDVATWSAQNISRHHRYTRAVGKQENSYNNNLPLLLN